MTSDIVRGHDEIVLHAKKLLEALPMPPGVEVTVPPRSSEEMGGRYLEYGPGDRLVAEFPARAQYVNALGLVQGGFVAAMFDNVFGGIGLMGIRKPLTTIDLHVEYLRPVLPGTVVRIDARIRKSGRSLVNASADALNSEGKVVATATTNFLVVDV
jgi:uncharacterized protein (TIGR00369 family)